MKPNQHSFTYKVPKEIWEIGICGKRVSIHLSTFLRESINGEAVAEYWLLRERGLVLEFIDINWTTYKMNMKSVPVSRRHWVRKFE